MTLKLIALPIAAAAIIGALAVLPDADPESRAPRSSTVTQSAYACPTPDGTSVATGRVRAGGSGSSTALAVPGERPIPDLGSAVGWKTGDVDGDAVVVSTTDAKGSGAVGFYAAKGTSKAGGGLSVGSCAGVTQDAWYLGAGSGGQHFTSLTLTNLSEATAIADISMWSDEGPVDAIDAEGIVLDAFETRRIKLEDLAAGEPQMAVRVESRRGALSVAADDRATAVFRGSEPISPAGQASRRLLIPGLIRVASGRQLMAFNPGSTTARVKVEALGKDGPFVPTGLEDKKIPAGEFTVIDLPASVGGDASALRLISDQPVTAAVRMSPSNSDFAYAVSGPRLSGPAVLPLSVGEEFDDVRLLLTAPGLPGRVEVTAYDDKMVSKGSVEIVVKSGSTLSYDLGTNGLFDAALDDLAYVVVKPSGKLYGAGQFTDGAGVSTVPLTAAPLTTFAPDVRPAR